MSGRSYVGSGENRYLYQGKEIQNETGWYDFGARMYDPTIGRFNSVDALADHPNQIGLSPYSAMWNNPISLTDPDGNCPNCPTNREFENALATDFLSVKHAFYNLFTRAFGYEATFVDSENGGYRTGFIETNDSYWTSVKKTTLDLVTVGTFGRGGGPTGGLVAKTGGWAVNSSIRQAAKLWTGITSTRFKIADNFYRRSGYQNYDSHLEGVDFSNPVSVQTLKKGTRISQWVNTKTGKVGSYFTPSNNKAQNLGLNDYDQRTFRTFELTKDVKALKSTAGDINGAKGGGTQFFNPELKNNLKKIENEF